MPSAFSRARLDGSRYQLGTVHYTIGNAFHALREEQEAKRAFEAALEDPALELVPELAAQIHKNLGSSYELLGEQEKAVDHYCEALRLAPDLAEAHNALGNHYVRVGRYEDALRHLDQVVFSERKQGRTSAVIGWRANVLFNLGDGRAAFREINGLMSQADRHGWIWPWCARLVATFGRVSVENARPAAHFWQRFINAHPGHSAATRELLMSPFYFRGQGEDVGKSYGEFRAEFERQIVHLIADDAALPWDRLGHCLGIALKQLGRFEESLPLLLEQAHTVQPDAMSWFQVASSYHSLGRWPEAVEAYEKALALDPHYAVAMFDLGGAHWNSGNAAAAAEVWRAPIERFPDHELAATVRREFVRLV